MTPSSYDSSHDNFDTDHSDNSTDFIRTDVDKLFDAVNKIETKLGMSTSDVAAGKVVKIQGKSIPIPGIAQNNMTWRYDHVTGAMVWTPMSVNAATYTQSTRPLASSVTPGTIIFVSDASVGSKFQGSTGSSWVNLDGEGTTEAQAPYPSRLHVLNHAIVDSSNFDLRVLKGFNTNVASTVGGESFTFSQTDYNDMSTLTNGAVVAGPGFNRLVMHWDVFEQSAGVFHGISSSTSAATAGSAFDSLDKSIQRAYNAGRYLLLEIHLLDAGFSNGRVPAWARTGTVPSGSGNSWTWFCTNGQGITETIAERYGDPATSPIGVACMAVVGFMPNEPAAILQDEIMDGHETIVPWYRVIVPLWPIWVSPFSYGGGTPYPGGVGSGAADVDVGRLLALDPSNVGIILDWHDYLNVTGTASSDGYQANGSIDPIEQVANGSEYYGWGTPRTYPNSSGSRADMAAHIAPLVTLKNANSRIALGVTEFGNDNVAQGSTLHNAWVKDKIDLYRASGVCVECWWQYGFGGTNFDARDGSGNWRTGISGSSWIGNTTVRS